MCFGLFIQAATDSFLAIIVAGIGAALATAKALQEHNVPGKVILLGTPAEEGDGGKIVMLKNGGYKEMDVSRTVSAILTQAY